MMQAADFAELKHDIGKHGQREQIVYHKGKLLDGRNRQKACEELKIAPQDCELDDDEDPVAWVMSANLHRRHLTTSQRAMVAAKLATLKNGHRPTSDEGGATIDSAASLLNVGRASVERAKQVIRDGSKTIHSQCAAGELPVSTAAKNIRPLLPKIECPNGHSPSIWTERAFDDLRAAPLLTNDETSLGRN